MTRMVFCKKYQADMQGLDFPPFPGAKGLEIFNTVSKQAWQDWLKHQTTLINEKRLNVMQPETKVYLDEQRERFLSNQTVEQAEGWVEEKKN